MDVSMAAVLPTIGRSGGGIPAAVKGPLREVRERMRSITVYGCYKPECNGDLDEWRDVTLSLEGCVGPERFAFRRGLLDSLLEHDIIHQHGLWTWQSIGVLRWRRRTGRPTEFRRTEC